MASFLECLGQEGGHPMRSNLAHDLTDQLPQPNPPVRARTNRREAAPMGARRRRVEPTRWRQPPAAMLAMRVSALDSLLGATIEGVKDLLRVQSLVLTRQECARRAVEAYRGCQGTEPCPRYLVDPVGALSRWPRPYADAPVW